MSEKHDSVQKHDSVHALEYYSATEKNGVLTRVHLDVPQKQHAEGKG